MGIDRDTVERIALLARLRLTDEELTLYQSQLGAILDYVEKLRELKVEGVEPLAHAAELADVRREDRAGPCLSTDEAMANAPGAHGPYFVVPRVLEGAPESPRTAESS